LGSPSTHSAASYSTVSALRWLQVRIVPEHFILPAVKICYPRLNRVKNMFSAGHGIKILKIKLEETVEELQLYKNLYIGNEIKPMDAL
jgi:hypothetical protein